jgi:NAD(P)-dependent dehydrogenase (short-subunit alcohol dehydrogenase family)
MPTVNDMTSQADRAGYNAWKAAVPLKTMAVELVSSGLRANFWCPPDIETSLNSAIAGDLGWHSADAVPAESIPLGQAGGLRKWSARTSSSIRPGVAHHHKRSGRRRELHCEVVNPPSPRRGRRTCTGRQENR